MKECFEKFQQLDECVLHRINIIIVFATGIFIPLLFLFINLSVLCTNFLCFTLTNQDDFLPRTTAALEDVFKSLLW